MESKTFSKVEQLRGLKSLSENQFYLFLAQAAETLVQQNLSTILSPDFIKTQDDTVRLLGVIGEMRGLRAQHNWLLTTIATLEVEVQKEQDSPQGEQKSLPQEQQDNVVNLEPI